MTFIQDKSGGLTNVRTTLPNQLICTIHPMSHRHKRLFRPDEMYHLIDETGTYRGESWCLKCASRVLSALRDGEFTGEQVVMEIAIDGEPL